MKTSVVSMDGVPSQASRSKYASIFDDLYKLNGDKALKVEFDTESQAAGAVTSLKKKATECGCKFRHSGVGAVKFFWVERPEDGKRR